MPILTAADYQQALASFTALLDQQPADAAPLTELRDTIAAYELSQGYPLPPPQTLVGRLELEMYRRRLSKKMLADLLEISPSRMSDVFRGQRINLDLAKRLHQKLGIPGDFILAAAWPPHCWQPRTPKPPSQLASRPPRRVQAGGKTSWRCSK